MCKWNGYEINLYLFYPKLYWEKVMSHQFFLKLIIGLGVGFLEECPSKGVSWMGRQANPSLEQEKPPLFWCGGLIVKPQKRSVCDIVFTAYIYIYISIRLPWTVRTLDIGCWCSMPRTKAKGALGSVPMVYNCWIISAAFPLSLRTNPHINLPPPHPPSCLWLETRSSHK